MHRTVSRRSRRTPERRKLFICARRAARARARARLQRAREINGIVSSVRATRNRARRGREIVTGSHPGRAIRRYLGA